MSRTDGVAYLHETDRRIYSAVDLVEARDDDPAIHPTRLTEVGALIPR